MAAATATKGSAASHSAEDAFDVFDVTKAKTKNLNAFGDDDDVDLRIVVVPTISA